MKRNLILISTLLYLSAYAQKNNENLRREFEQQKVENEKKFDTYAERVYGKNPDPETKKKIDSLKSRLGGFNFDVPYFLQEQDTRQLMNSNSDLLNTSGNITIVNCYTTGNVLETTGGGIIEIGRAQV
jgi:hypothetical protein